MNANKEIWVWVEQRSGKLMDVSLQTLGKAAELCRDLGAKLTAILIGDKKGLAKDLISYGAEKVYFVSSLKLKYYESCAYTKIITRLIEQHKPEIMLFGATSIGVDLAASVAARVNTGLTAHCSDLYIENIDNKPQLAAIVPGFSGGMIVKIICPEKRPQMATVSSGITEKPIKDENRQGEIIEIEEKPSDISEKIETLEMVEKQPASKPVEGASIVVSAGKGIIAGDGFELASELAESLDAALGGTRPVRDAGLISDDNMIGSSGMTVSPKLFISIGASGAAHYTTGFLKSNYVVAINKDPEAPIFDACDLGVQADLNEFIPLLLKEIKALK